MVTMVDNLIKDLERERTKKLLKNNKELKNALAKCFLKNDDIYDSFDEFYFYIQRKRVPVREEWNKIYSSFNSEIKTGDFNGAEWLSIELVQNLSWLSGDRLEYLFERMAIEPLGYSTDENDGMYLSVSESDSKTFYERANEELLYYCNEWPVKVRGYLWFDHEDDYEYAANKNDKCLNCAFIYDDKGRIIGKLNAIHLWDMFLISVPKKVPIILNKAINVEGVAFEENPVPFTNGTLFLISN